MLKSFKKSQNPTAISISAGLLPGSKHFPLSIETGRVLRFWFEYRKSALKADEIISEIRVPLPKPSQEMRVYKISKRYDQDISTVCGAFSVTLKNGVVEDCKIAFGGMAATSQRCKAAEKILIGQSIDDDLISMAKSKIRSSFEPMDDMRGSAEYRSIVSANLLERFVQDVVGEDIGVMGL